MPEHVPSEVVAAAPCECAMLRRALQRVMREVKLPAYYGPGSWWDEAVDALNPDAALCPPDGQDGPETGVGVSGHGGAGAGAVRGAEGVGYDEGGT